MNKLTLTLLVLICTIISYGQNKGHFNISTNPSSAIVRLTEFPDVEKRTPASFSDYKPMLYSIRVEKHNYQTIDTLIHCLPGRIIDYHFNLIPKSSICNITSTPSGAQVFINHQKVGVTPINDYSISCGSNVITLINEHNVKWQETFTVDESYPLLVSHNFYQTEVANDVDYMTSNKTYSTPTNQDFYDTDDSNISENETYGGFGAVGFYTMLGSNGAKGTSYRYGADLFHYIRIWGESNKESDIQGFGLEGVLPLDLDKAGLYLKGGLVSRSFEPLNSYGRQSIGFVTVGAGISIKPTPHFQIFGEFEFGMFDEEQNQDTIDLWKEKHNNFSTLGGWIGIRVAF